MSFTREQFQGDESGANSAEALAIVDFQTFRFDDPETDIGATLVVTPSLTDAGAVASQLYGTQPNDPVVMLAVVTL